MGYDAYGLARAIAGGALQSTFGLSGMLEVDADRRIHRRMPWAEFRNGRIVALPEASIGRDTLTAP
jgi:outer membrane PBP1 activator LpoA protein